MAIKRSGIEMVKKTCCVGNVIYIEKINDWIIKQQFVVWVVCFRNNAQSKCVVEIFKILSDGNN